MLSCRKASDLLLLHNRGKAGQSAAKASEVRWSSYGVHMSLRGSQTRHAANEKSCQSEK